MLACTPTHFRADHFGVTSIEYGLLAALIAVGIMSGIAAMGSSVESVMCLIENRLGGTCATSSTTSATAAMTAMCNDLSGSGSLTLTESGGCGISMPYVTQPSGYNGGLANCSDVGGSYDTTSQVCTVTQASQIACLAFQGTWDGTQCWVNGQNMYENCQNPPDSTDAPWHIWWNSNATTVIPAAASTQVIPDGGQTYYTCTWAN